MLKRVGAWIVDRFGLRKLVEVVARHPVPPETADRRKGWMYVFGTATLFAFLLQVVTGIALATKYVPAPSHAYGSLVFITDEVWFGSFLRGMHFFGASAMVILVAVHLGRVFLTASFKFPREANWLSGVVLLVLVVLMTFTGQLLRWDANGVWGVYVASHYAARVPLIGGALQEFMLAGQTIGGATLTRYYSFHVILLPLLIFALIGLHVYLVFRHGVSEPPKAGRPVDPATYRSWYSAHLERSRSRYFPDVAWREAVFIVLVLAVVVALAYLVGPRGPGEPPDPTRIPTEPKPDWFLLWYYGLIAIKPPALETFMMVYLPILVLLAMFLLPLVFGRGERSLRRRPAAILIAGLTITAFGVLTALGARAPWVMDFETEPLAPHEVGAAEGPVWVGAQLFHERGCQYCHAVAGRGGAYGPGLDEVMRRLPPEVVTTRIVGGYRNMPAYRGTLPRDELEAILVFLRAMGER